MIYILFPYRPVLHPTVTECRFSAADEHEMSPLSATVSNRLLKTAVHVPRRAPPTAVMSSASLRTVCGHGAGMASFGSSYKPHYTVLITKH